MSAVRLLYVVLVVGCASEAIAEGVAGDGWRSFALALATLLLVALRRDLTEKEVSL